MQQDTQDIYIMFSHGEHGDSGFSLAQYVAAYKVDVRYRCGEHGEWIVHRSISRVDGTWTITYAPSSMLVYNHKNLKEAKALARALASVNAPLRMPPVLPQERIVERNKANRNVFDGVGDAVVYRLDEVLYKEFKEWISVYRNDNAFRSDCRDIILSWKESIKK